MPSPAQTYQIFINVDLCRIYTCGGNDGSCLGANKSYIPFDLRHTLIHICGNICAQRNVWEIFALVCVCWSSIHHHILWTHTSDVRRNKHISHHTFTLYIYSQLPPIRGAQSRHPSRSHPQNASLNIYTYIFAPIKGAARLELLCDVYMWERQSYFFFVFFFSAMVHRIHSNRLHRSATWFDSLPPAHILFALCTKDTLYAWAHWKDFSSLFFFLLVWYGAKRIIIRTSSRAAHNPLHMRGRFGIYIASSNSPKSTPHPPRNVCRSDKTTTFSSDCNKMSRRALAVCVCVCVNSGSRKSVYVWLHPVGYSMECAPSLHRTTARTLYTPRDAQCPSNQRAPAAAAAAATQLWFSFYIFLHRRRTRSRKTEPNEHIIHTIYSQYSGRFTVSPVRRVVWG